jgi:hypothetical protein
MSSVSSVNPGLQSLLQSLSNIGSPVLSSPSVVSALQNAPPSDIVQLSAEATQLEGVDAMFGMSSDSSGTDAVMQNLDSLLAAPSSAPASTSASPSASTSASPTPSSSSAQQEAYQAAVQSAETESLLGGTSSGSSIDALF